jgi:chromosome segregation ATPase
MTTKTKTKKPENRTGVLEERIRTLEQQRQRASDAITEAEDDSSEIKERQDAIAVAVVAQERAAVEEMAGLEEALLLETRRAAVGRTAEKQLDAQIAQAKEALAAEERREHLERAADLARERHSLEERCEQEVATLLATLSELEQLDRRHCQELRAGGLQTPTEPLGWMVEEWLLTRLTAWVSENPRHQGFAAKDLPELDGLASEATPEDA